MDEREQRANGFCPQCGALMRDGVCGSCGFCPQKESGPTLDEEKEKSAGSGNGRKKMSAGAKVVVALCVILVLLLIALIVSSIPYFVMKSDEWESSIFQEFGDHIYDDGYDFEDEYEEYVPDPEDEYYRELADAVGDGLSYSVTWHAESVYTNKDYTGSLMYCDYPAFDGDNADALKRINDRIRDEAFRYQDEIGADGYISVDSYVTYLSEERLSVAMQYYMNDSDYRVFLRGFVFDAATGEEIPSSSFVQPDLELAAWFREKSEIQNGVDYELEEMTDAELLAYMEDPDRFFVFLTPVGTELGINNDGYGWVSVTMKDGELQED
ncbi:MAG: zinc ribbon domain-containing protein [Eubacteriales bacterium]|nr:zinc ribbon domain-containing protein [Eubacteriales bacterium]